MVGFEVARGERKDEGSVGEFYNASLAQCANSSYSENGCR